MGILDKVTKRDDSKKKPAKKQAPKKESKKKTEVKADIHSSAYKVLMSPHITEKAAQAEANGKYIFKVAVDASKEDVKKAIRKVYGVSPKNIRVINVLGKKSRSGHKNRKPVTFKKAIVTLNSGDSIQIYEGV